MKILFLTTIDPDKQGDYGECSSIIGFRELLGNNFVEYPKKKILYGDFSDSPKYKLHGKGFTYCSPPYIKDTNYNRDNLNVKDFDVIIQGSGHIYGERWDIKHNNIWTTDFNDIHGNAPKIIDYCGEKIIGCQFEKNCFKSQLVEGNLLKNDVFTTGFGIPSNKIIPFNFNKTGVFQSTAPTDACFYYNSDYRFTDESAYYENMNRSWFGLTCKKGSYDSLRHYEILASGALLLYKDYDKKPSWCSPINLPTISYSAKEELYEIMNKLVINNKPTKEYYDLLFKQREWLLTNGTCVMRAQKMLHEITNCGIY